MFASVSANAATVILNDEAKFLANSHTTETILPNLGRLAAGTGTVGDLTFNLGGGDSTEIFMGTNGVEGMFGPQFSDIVGGNDIAISGSENFSIDIARTVTAFSFVVAEPTEVGPASSSLNDVCNATCYDTTFGVSLFRGGVFVDSFSFNPIDNTRFFVGVLENNGFDRVVITDNRASADNEFFGEFRIGSVPVPASLPLLLVGFAGLGLVRRRGRG